MTEAADARYHQSASASLIHEGVSQTLIGALQALAEQTEIDGRRRHPEQAVRRIRQAVLCRNYAGLCLELAWLLDTISRGQPQRPDAVLRAFYIDNLCTCARFSEAVRSGKLSMPKLAQVDDGQLRVQRAQDSFTLHLDRLPTWVCLLELLVFIDPGLLQKPGSLTPTELANALQKCLYGYLAEHAQPSHQQRRFRGMLEWLREQAPEQPAGDAITDQRIFDYWMAPPPMAGDVARYRTVAEAFLNLRVAMAVGARAAAAGQEVVFDEAVEGLVCSDAIEEWVGVEVIDLTGLTLHPRFLTTRSAQELDLLARFPEAVHRHPLTLMRMRVLGTLQARTIDAAKRKQSLADVVMTGSDYSEWVSVLRDLRTELESLALAAIAVVLAQRKHAEGLAALLEWIPETTDALHQIGEALAAPGIPNLAAIRLQSPALNEILQRAERALKATARAGFKGAEDYAQPEDYEAGIADLRQLATRIERFLACDIDWAEKYAGDLPITRTRLINLHAGDVDVHE